MKGHRAGKWQVPAFVRYLEHHKSGNVGLGIRGSECKARTSAYGRMAETRKEEGGGISHTKVAWLFAAFS